MIGKLVGSAGFLSSGGTIGGHLTIDGDLTVTGSGAGYAYTEVLTGDMVIQDTTDNATGGVLRLQNTRGGGAGSDGDDAGTISFYASDAGSNSEEMSTILSEVNLNTTGSTAGKLTFKTMQGNSSTALLTLSGWAGGSHASTVSSAVFNTSLVGIGTAAPSTILEIAGAHTGGLGMLHLDSTDHAFITLDSASSSHDSGIFFKEAGTTQMRLEFDASENAINFHDSIGGASRMVVTQAGNVGIGVVAPQSLLHLNVGLTDSEDAAVLTLSTYDSTITNTTGLGRIDFSGTENNSAWDVGARIISEATEAWTVGSAAGANLQFFTNANSGTALGARMVLDGNSRISLSNNDGGEANTIFGKNAGDSDGAGDYNVFIGEGAAGTGTQTDDADGNVGVGYNALQDLTQGAYNTSIGWQSGLQLLTGDYNVFVGNYAGEGTTAGEKMTFVGGAAGRGVSTTDAEGAVGIGYAALNALTSGAGNVAVGYNAGTSITTNTNCTFIGYQAGMDADAANTSPVSCTYIGSRAGENIDDGTGANTAVGYAALFGATSNANTAANNVAVGVDALFDVTSGGDNVGVGKSALESITTGGSNVAVGSGAGDGWSTQSQNTVVGHDAASNSGAGNITAVGYKALEDCSSDGAVALGHSAGMNITSGAGNTAVGYQALMTEDTGPYSTAIGHSALKIQDNANGKNTAVGYNSQISTSAGQQNTSVGNLSMQLIGGSSANNNVAIGNLSMQSSGTIADNVAANNTAVGADSLKAITLGLQNVAVGSSAGVGITTANKCVLLGSYAGDAITVTNSATSDGTVAVGYEALTSLTSGIKNTAVGYQALYSNSLRSDTTAIGYQALYTVAGSNRNTAVGSLAGYSSAGNDCVYVGRNAGQFTGDADGTTAIGKDALMSLTSNKITGVNNTAIGRSSGTNIVGAGHENTLLGALSGATLTTGSDNTLIGKSADTDDATAINQTVIGHSTTGVADNSVTLGNADVTAVYMAQDSGATVNCGQVVSANTAIDTTGSFTGFSQTYKKTLGVTNSADNFIGTYITMEFDDDGAVDGTFGTLAGARIYSICTDSVGAGSAIYGTDTLAKLTVGNPDNVYGAYTTADIDGGTVDVSVHGANIVVDMDGGACGNDLYGLNVYADIDGGTIGDKLLGAKIAVNSTVNPATNARALYLLMDGSGLANDSDNFIHCYDDASNTNRFLVRMDGQVDAEGAINASQSLDYAEYFESKDGKQIAIGTTVKLDGGKIIACSDGDTPIGVIRPDGAPAMINGGQSFHWQDKYMKDDYGSKILENYTQTVWKEEVDFDEYSKRGKTSEEHELYSKVDGLNGESDTYFKEHSYHTDRIPDGLTVPDDAVVTSGKRDKLNPDYDDSKTYQPRKERSEWHIVGLLGQIPITKGQPTGSWIKMKDVSDTVEMYFVK